jgi:hypothetical protein
MNRILRGEYYAEPFKVVVQLSTMHIDHRLIYHRLQTFNAVKVPMVPSPDYNSTDIVHVAELGIMTKAPQ